VVFDWRRGGALKARLDGIRGRTPRQLETISVRSASRRARRHAGVYELKRDGLDVWWSDTSMNSMPNRRSVPADDGHWLG